MAVDLPASFRQNLSQPLLPWITPRNTIEIQKGYRIRRTQFGDGYQHKRPDGINIQQERTSLTYILTASQRDTLITFIDGLEGSTNIKYTLPNESVVKIWEITSVSQKMVDNTAWEVSLELNRVYEP